MEQLRGYLHATALRVSSRDDAEDAVQTVLLKLQAPEALRRLRSSRSPAGYLVMMLRNASVDLSRGRREQRDDGREADLPDDTPSPVDLVSQADRERDLRRILATLSQSDRELIRLRYFDELSIAEIARRRRMNYSAVAVRLFRIVMRLKNQQAADADS